MKAKMSYKSKRLAIIVAIIVALIIAISIGTYYFIKANTEVGAAYENTQGIEENDNGESEVTEPSENQEENQNDENETEISDENNENQTQNGTTEENEGDESVSQEGTSTEGTTTGTSNSELPNEEYTQTEIVEREEERIEEGLTVTWAGLSLANAQISSDIVTSGPNLEINKVAKLNSINENDNAIQKGSKITYEITVANTNTEVVAKNVNISDVIPEGTTLVENSISHNGIEVEDKISWVIPEITSENPVTVSFTVEVVNEKGEIKNTAVVDGKNTPETINPVIETSKTVSSENSKLTELKEGSEIEYSIKVTNTSKEEQAIAKTTVKDSVPEGTTLVEGSITGTENYIVEEINGQKVITWNNITLNPEESIELKFKVTINAFEGESKEIKNVALVGDTNTNEEKVTVYNPILSIYKSADPEKVSEGDTITYTITVKNDGKVDGLATIKDNIPTGTTFTDRSIQINDETTTKTAEDLVQGIQVNVPAEDSVTLTFEVTVNSNSGLTGNISNTAYLVDEKGNETPTDPTETKVEAKIVFVENGGTDVADIDGYAGDIIENRNPKPTRQGYNFVGWYEEPEFENKVEQLPEKMIAGTTTYYANWEPRNDTAYTVEYYQENLDGKDYTKVDTVNATGTTGTEATYEVKEYAGFTYKEELTIPEDKTIKGDGSLVIKLYYDRNENTAYTVEYYQENLDGKDYTKVDTVNATGTTGAEATYEVKEYAGFTYNEELTTPEDKTIKGDGSLVIKLYYDRNENTAYKVEHYQENLEGEGYTKVDTVNATGTTGAEATYEVKEYAGFTYKEELTTPEDKIIKGDGSLVIKLYYDRNTDTPYTVEYYYETNGNYATTPDSTDGRTGTTGAKVIVTDKDKQSAKAGYMFDNSYQGNILDGTIRGDGSLKLKVYFKQQFTVKYNPGTQGNFENEEYTTTYGAKTPEFKGQTTGKEGFYFAGWDKEIAETVTKDVEYTALWEGLDISKTRTEIVDKDELDNTFVDQAGDIIKYTIKITNVGDVNASNIKLTDNHKVKVTGVKIGAVNVDISARSNVFEAGKDLLEGLTTTIEPNTSIEVTVEYTVTENELKEALESDSKAIINTATATLNGHKYEAKDKTNGKTGTEVKERATYTIEYYYNGILNEDKTIKGSTIVGATISFNRPSELEGYTYIKYVGVDGKDNSSTTAIDGLNVIKVYYGKPEISITKGSTETVNAGENIKYTITVKNTGYIGTTVTVTDELLGTTYVKNSSKIDNKTSEPTITTNKDKNEVLSWKITLDAQDSKEITFEVTTANDSFGDKVSNTAKIKDSDKSASTSSKVNEINVKYNEYKEGQKGTDLNIIFVLDNSSSMNYPIEGQSYKYNNNPIAPTDKDKTRIENAKEAIKGFIDNQSSNANTDMSVITFNTTNTGEEKGYKTLMYIKEEDIIEEKEWVEGWFGGHWEVKKYVMINGNKYRVTNDKVTGSDGNKYYGVYLPIKHGARLIGTNADSNNSLKTAVDNISISSEKSGFATYVENAFSLINNNKKQYLSDTKKNIVIVLADGEFNGNYWNALTTLKGNVDDIYSIGFGSGKDYDAEALKEVSTNNTCYTATNSSDLLEKFNEILEEATGTEQSGITEKGKITFKQATGDIKISEDCPIEATYIDSEGTTQTLFKCTSEKDLSNYGLSISGGRITWDAKQFVNNKNTKVPGEISIKYYIAREQ